MPTKCGMLTVRKSETEYFISKIFFSFVLRTKFLIEILRWGVCYLGVHYLFAHGTSLTQYGKHTTYTFIYHATVTFP